MVNAIKKEEGIGSIENAKAFVEKIKTDEKWRLEVDAVKTNEERLGLAKAAGFDFTVAEFHEVSSAMSEEELAAVTGSGV